MATKAHHDSLVAILSHPLRYRILAILDTRVASPAELRRMLPEVKGDVSYHVRELHKLGAIELVNTRQVRGATEHFYRATERPIFTDAQLERMTSEERADLARFSLQLFTAKAAASLDAGTFGDRADAWLTLVPGSVDEEGWEELGEAYKALWDRVFEILATSAERGDPSIPVLSVQALFERAPEIT